MREYNVKWSPSAQNDIEKIYAFYAEKSVNAAVKVFNGIIDDTEILKHNPQIAPVEQFLLNNTKTYRSLVASKGKYKVVFFVEDRTIYIARIWNCRQNPKSLRIRR